MAVEAGGIGARLRAGREKLGLTVFQAAERLHTDPRIVDALEADDFAILGAPVYARGHIKHYAELVGESVAELNALYVDRSHVAQPDLTKIAKAPPSAGSSKLVLPALVAIIVFAVAGAVWWLSALEKQAPRLNETHVVEPVSPPASSTGAGEAADAAQAEAPGGASADGASSGGATVGGASPGSGVTGGASAGKGATGSAVAGKGVTGSASAGKGATGSGVAGKGATGAVAAVGAASASGGAGTGGVAAGRAAAGKGSAGGAAAGGTGAAEVARGPVGAPAATGAANTSTSSNATVTLRYSADSWTEVYDASGQRLFYDVGAANTVQKFSGAYPLRVVLGNASGVSVEFNGRNASIANLLHPDGSAQFSINRSGRVVRARPAADGG